MKNEHYGHVDFLADTFIMIILTVVLVGLIFWGCSGCDILKTPPPLPQDSKTFSFDGVVVTMKDACEGEIRNSNDFLVRVREIYIYDANERTWCMMILNPGETKKLDGKMSHPSFYIYNKEGGLMGFIKTDQ